jgi:hypothetical protein
MCTAISEGDLADTHWGVKGSKEFPEVFLGEAPEFDGDAKAHIARAMCALPHLKCSLLLGYCLI